MTTYSINNNVSKYNMPKDYNKEITKSALKRKREPKNTVGSKKRVRGDCCSSKLTLLLVYLMCLWYCGFAYFAHLFLGLLELV